jgi:hypothetical protein
MFYADYEIRMNILLLNARVQETFLVWKCTEKENELELCKILCLMFIRNQVTIICLAK